MWQRWAGRVGWFAAGAVAYALIFGRGDEPPVAEHDHEHEHEHEPAAQHSDPAPAQDVPPPEPAPAANRADVPPPVVEPDVPASRLDVPEVVAAPTGPAPKFPLPRMPGTRKLRASTTPADDGRGWVLVQTLRVPAKLSQVESFYRKALTDQGLAVTGGSNPARPNRAFLRGRSRRAHADVTITTKEGKLQTTVRTIWRTFR